MKKLRTTKQICEILGISSSKLYKLTMNREIPHMKIMGRLRFDEEKIQEWWESQAIEVKTADKLEEKARKIGGNER